MADPNYTNQKKNNSSALALFVRTFWMFLGNAALGICFLMLAQTKVLFSVTDVVYWLTAGLLLAARYADVAYFKGDTAYGEPATMAHWRKYAIGLLALAVGAWLVAHGIGFLLPK